MPSMRISGWASMNLAVASAECMVEMGRGPWGWMVSSEELEERKQRRVEIQATEGNNDQRPVASRDEEAMVMQTGNQCCGEMPDVLAHTKRDGGVRTCGGGGEGLSTLLVIHCMYLGKRRRWGVTLVSGEEGDSAPRSHGRQDSSHQATSLECKGNNKCL
jgi:hypothetical protein